MQFLFAVSIYMSCVLAMPDTGGEEVIDLEEHYWRQRLYILGAWLGTELLSLVANTTFLKTPNAALLLRENAATLAMIAVTIPLLLFRARWVQWTGIALLCAMMVAFVVTFDSALV